MRKSFKFNNNKVELNISYYSQKEKYNRTRKSCIFSTTGYIYTVWLCGTPGVTILVGWKKAKTQQRCGLRFTIRYVKLYWQDKRQKGTERLAASTWKIQLKLGCNKMKGVSNIRNNYFSYNSWYEKYAVLFQWKIYKMLTWLSM